jgi:hypothetical protein
MADMLGAAAPPEDAVNFHVGQGEEVIGQVASGKSSDACD